MAAMPTTTKATYDACKTTVRSAAIRAQSMTRSSGSWLGTNGGGPRVRGRTRGLRANDGQATATAPAAVRRASALSVRSQVNSGSDRPKWPPLAVLR